MDERVAAVVAHPIKFCYLDRFKARFDIDSKALVLLSKSGCALNSRFDVDLKSAPFIFRKFHSNLKC